jgi:hypothetical protein
MPNAWTDKDERQYEHIKGGELKRGRSTKRAKSIAAATVNKTRGRRTGATGSARTKIRKSASGRKKRS